MPTDFTLPELGENITAGDVVRVLVSPGDTVAKDQPVLELETDKATIEVPSTWPAPSRRSGSSRARRIKVGQVVLTLDDGAAATGTKARRRRARQREAAASGSREKPSRSPPAAAEDGGMSQRAPGRRREPRADAAARRAGSRGAARRPRRTPEAQQATRRRRNRSAARSSTSAAAPGAPAAAPRGASRAGARPPPAAPSVRRLARELGVDIRQVPGSGPRRPHQRRRRPGSSCARRCAGGGAAAGAGAGSPLPDFTKWGEVERKPMSNIRRKTAEHLAHAWNAIPHVTQHDKADITALEELRKQYAPQAEKAGGKLTVTAIALKIVAAALRKFPQFNASIDMRAQRARLQEVRARRRRRRYATRPARAGHPRRRPQGHHRARRRSWRKVSEKARAGKLSLDDMQGGGFTITNLGGIGGTSFTPIVNWPEVAILGMSRGSYEPVYNGAAFEPRLMLPLSLSYDHRVIDGADGARFLRWVAEAFEQPFVMALVRATGLESEAAAVVNTDS